MDKVIHLPTAVGGNSWGLAQGEKALGLEADVLVLFNSWLKYPADRVLFENAPRTVYQKIKCVATILSEIFSIRNKYNVFHFNSGTTLLDLWKLGLPLLDLPVYKPKGKIVVTFNGCDARQKYPTIARTEFSACHSPDCYGGFCSDGSHDRINQIKVKKFDHYADHIFALNPDLLHFLPAKARFLPYTIANWNEITTQPWTPSDKPLKIIHAPTNRAAKGSANIIEALDKVRERYGDVVEINLVENMAYADALKVYATADLIIDQVLVGWYGAFAVEAMKMGKPVMAYVRREDLHFLPEQMAADCHDAIINTNPGSIFLDLCNIIDNRHILKKYREAALEYVNKWHNPLHVAGITKEAYEN